MAYDTYMHLFFKKQPNGKLREIIVENNKSAVQVGEAKGKIGNYPFFTSGDAILEWDCSMVDGRNCFLNTGGNAGVKFYIGDAAYSTDTWCITANSNLEDYLYLLLLSIKPELNQKFFQGTGLKHLQKPLLRDRIIYIPFEQEIKGFNSKVQPLMDMISANTRENKRLINLRNWLLPMLMNGQTRVNTPYNNMLMYILSFSMLDSFFNQQFVLPHRMVLMCRCSKHRVVSLSVPSFHLRKFQFRLVARSVDIVVIQKSEQSFFGGLDIVPKCRPPVSSGRCRVSQPDSRICPNAVCFCWRYTVACRHQRS